MKYHYQYVAKNSVRIELIPEDQKEKALIEVLTVAPETDPQLVSLFQTALTAYSKDSTITKLKFMNFPKVALCSFVMALKPVAVAIEQEKTTLF